MSFAKYLDEDTLGIELGPNTFIYAVGSSNDLGWHADRGSFSLDLTTEEETSTSSSSTSAVTDVSFAPTSVGTSTVGEAVTPSPSIVSRPLLRTTEPTVLPSEGSGNGTVELSETTTSSTPTIASTKTEASVEWEVSNSTNATEAEDELSTPSPSVTDEISSLQPTVTSNTTSNATKSEDGLEEDTQSDTMLESDAKAEVENGTISPAHAMGSLLLGIVITLIMM
jgi:hypothetical protein